MDFKEFIQEMKKLVLGAESGAAPAAPAGKTFSEADLAAQVTAAKEEATRQTREQVAAEFAEKEKKARQEARRAEISSWCEAQVTAGRLTPALVKFGLPEMLAAFAEKEEVIEFGETKDKATLYDRFKALFETELPKVLPKGVLVTFEEVATRDKDTGGASGAGEKLSALVRKKMEADKALSYGAAFAEVQRENPDLAREYHQEIGG